MPLPLSFIFVCFAPLIRSQTTLTLYDRVNRKPVADALVFIDKADYNVLSRKDGSITIDRVMASDEALNITYLNYDFNGPYPRNVHNGDTICLHPSDHQLSSIDVFAKSSHQRKQWIRQFEDIRPLVRKKIETNFVQRRSSVDLDTFFDLLAGDKKEKEAAFEALNQEWQAVHLAPALDILLFSRDANIRRRLVRLLESKTGFQGGADYYKWLTHLWTLPPTRAPFYADLKAEIYSKIDPAFSTYFAGRSTETSIRLDEVVWGGVGQDGIPPLRQPKLLFADQASYLSDNDIVFGVSIKGDDRAYPKRILGWHEMVTDKVGGVNIAGVYCTLCGTVIVYDMTVDGVFHDLGTSGFLYRSNKLMYDGATQSLWNTIEGRPVIGPLTDQNIQLTTYPVVTTTWGAWKKDHPGTLVLSPDTGHRRDYSEGAAYRDYYATDRLMFPVPQEDGRLKNKDEVLVIRPNRGVINPLAVSVNYIEEHPVIYVEMDDKRYVILTKPDGASYVFEGPPTKSVTFDGQELLDSTGRRWLLTEQALVSGDDKLNRIPAHRIFWFAWYNTYPHTRLIK